jgi:hypothetical protein
VRYLQLLCFLWCDEPSPPPPLNPHPGPPTPQPISYATQLVSNADGGGVVRQRGGTLPCPYRAPGDAYAPCKAAPYPIKDLGALLDASTRSALTEAALAALAIADAEAARLRTELIAAAEAGGSVAAGRAALRAAALGTALEGVTDRAGRIRVIFNKFVDWHVTLRCPRCQLAFAGYDGCDALRCSGGYAGGGAAAGSGCGAFFCALCLTEFPSDMACHKHVAEANHHNDASLGYFGEQDRFKAFHKKRSMKELEEAVAGLREPPDVKAELLAAFEKSLRADAPRAGEKQPWRCESCMFRNEASAPACGGCGQYRAGHGGDGDGEDGGEGDGDGARLGGMAGLLERMRRARGYAPVPHVWEGQGQRLGGGEGGEGGAGAPKTAAEVREARLRALAGAGGRGGDVHAEAAEEEAAAEAAAARKRKAAEDFAAAAAGGRLGGDGGGGGGGGGGGDPAAAEERARVMVARAARLEAEQAAATRAAAARAAAAAAHAAAAPTEAQAAAAAAAAAEARRAAEVQAAKDKTRAAEREKLRVQLALLQDKAEREAKPPPLGHGFVTLETAGRLKELTDQWEGRSTVVVAPTPAACKLLVDSLPSQRTGSVGLIAAQTITKLMKNVLEHPDEQKYRKIPWVKGKGAYVKVAEAFSGPKLLMAMGWVPGPEVRGRAAQRPLNGGAAQTPCML